MSPRGFLGVAWLTLTLGLAACTAALAPETGDQPPVTAIASATATVDVPATADDPQPSSTPTPTRVPSPASNDPSPADAAAAKIRQVLQSQLQLTAEEVSLIGIEPVSWSDSCLGLGTAYEACAAVLTPGYRVTLEAEGIRYIYRSDAEAITVRLEERSLPGAGQVILRWHSGNEPCQAAIFTARAVAHGPCGSELQVNSLVSLDRVRELAEFQRLYAPIQAETAAGTIDLIGSGFAQATAAEQRMIAEWAHLASQEAEAGAVDPSRGLVLTWHREGGFAGFCDDLAVYVTGTGYASSCKSGKELGMLHMGAEELAQFYAWLDSLQPYQVDKTDPATADAMTVRMQFSGRGTTEAGEKEQLDLAAFAARFYATGAVLADATYVQAQQDLTIFSGPGEGNLPVGPLFEGNTALVTGASPDGNWWRVICPDDQVDHCWISANPELTVPVGPMGLPGLDLADEIAIYAAVIRQVYTVDHTFGQPPNFPVVYLLAQGRDESGSPGEARSLSPQLELAVLDALSDLPARFQWVPNMEVVPRGQYDEVADNGAVIEVGPIEPQGDDVVHVAGSIYFAPLGAGGQTYVLELIDGAWQVTGNTGSVWIS